MSIPPAPATATITGTALWNGRPTSFRLVAVGDGEPNTSVGHALIQPSGRFTCETLPGRYRPVRDHGMGGSGTLPFARLDRGGGPAGRRGAASADACRARAHAARRPPSGRCPRARGAPPAASSSPSRPPTRTAVRSSRSRSARCRSSPSRRAAARGSAWATSTSSRRRPPGHGVRPAAVTGTSLQDAERSGHEVERARGAVEERRLDAEHHARQRCRDGQAHLRTMWRIGYGRRTGRRTSKTRGSRSA